MEVMDDEDLDEEADEEVDKVLFELTAGELSFFEMHTRTVWFCCGQSFSLAFYIKVMSLKM